MEAKTYLKQYRNKIHKIEMLTESIEELDERATCITCATDGDRVQSSGNKDKIGTIVAKICDLKEERVKETEEAIEMLQDIEGTIRKIPKERLQRIIYLHYVRGNSWEKVAVAVGCDVRHVHRLHGEALMHLNKIINK